MDELLFILSLSNNSIFNHNPFSVRKIYWSHILPGGIEKTQIDQKEEKLSQEKEHDQDQKEEKLRQEKEHVSTLYRLRRVTWTCLDSN